MGGPVRSSRRSSRAPATATDVEAIEDLGRVFTVPNLLSLARLGLLAWSLVLLFADRDRIAAAVVLGVAGTTDFLDGYVARRLHQVSTLGKILDPTVDRIVLGAAIIAVVVYGAAPAWLAALVLGRELLVSGAGIVLAMRGARRLDVLWVGKVATFGLMFAFPGFLLGHGPGLAARVLGDIAWVIAVPSCAVSLYAAWRYIPMARDALAPASPTPSANP